MKYKSTGSDDNLVDSDHNGCRLDNGIGFFADLKAEVLDGAHGDVCCDQVSASDVNGDDGVHSAFLDVDYFAFELVSCTDFHGGYPPFKMYRGMRVLAFVYD